MEDVKIKLEDSCSGGTKLKRKNIKTKNKKCT
jgi:hypothetical protein